MDFEDDYPLHAIINQVADGRRQWLKDKGVGVDSWIVEGGLKDLLQYLESKGVTAISEEEMKAQWEELDKKAEEKIDAVLTKTPRILDVPNDIGTTALRLAVDKGNTTVAAVLLKHKANVEATDEYGSTVLHVAVRNGNNEMVSFLLSQGAELTAREEYGSTTLHTAVRSGNVEIVKMLLQRGASVNSVEEDGSTPLHAASSSGNTNVVRVLLKHGADIHAVEVDDRTALHVAACYSNTEIVQVLLDAGASITAVNKVGRTALHFAACYSSTDMVELLLRNGADIDSVDGDSHNPLGYLIQALKYDMDDKSIAVARLLCSKGSEANLSDDVVSSLSTHQLGLLECTSYWHHQADGKLADIPSEVIKGGVNSVRAYLGDLKKPTEEKKHEILHRCKVCIVGPSTWGKTSFIRSMKTGEPSLEGPDGRTIGINRFSMSFEEGRADGVKRYEVTFWDFAGQDIYQVAHALFFSKRTLYLLCVDLEKYASHLRGEYGNDAMRRFFEERVLRWLVFVLVRQPEAQFKLIGTKRDLVSESELEAITRDVKTRLIEFVTHPFVKIKDEFVARALTLEFDQDLVATSATNIASVRLARDSIQNTISAHGDLSFPMTPTYSQVLEYIYTMRLSFPADTRQSVEQLILPQDVLIPRLLKDIGALNNSARLCQEILRTLHRLGDILWYEDEDEGPNVRNWIILDPTIMLNIVSEIISHTHETRVGDCYDMMRRDGTLQHTLLMSFTWWNVLTPDMVLMFKRLLRHFSLAYAISDEMVFDSDIIVPTYWKTRTCSNRSATLQRTSTQEQHHIIGSGSATWQYSLPVGISKAIYVNFVVQCYQPGVERLVEADFLTSFVLGELATSIHFGNKDARCDTITIKVIALTDEFAWAEMRYFVIAMEQVLLAYPGLDSPTHRGVERFVVGDEPQPVTSLMENKLDEERLRKTRPWLPPDFGWFLQCVWAKTGKLEQLRTNHYLERLEKLIVESDKRRFPAVWTLSYPKDGSIIELRMHSDLTGRCYHDPLQITVPSEFETFVAEHASIIKVGISILSIAASAIPVAVASTAVGVALSGSSSLIGEACTIKPILERANLILGEVQSADGTEMPWLARLGFLRDLLKLHSPPLDEFTVSLRSNLRCAARNGAYVWMYPDELTKLKGELTPCACISLRVMDTPGLWKSDGRYGRKKNIICDWELVHRTRTEPIKKGQSTIQLNTVEGPVWMSPSIPLENVDSVKMFRECTLKITIKRRRRWFSCRKAKEIGRGEHSLEHLDVDAGFCGSKDLQVSVSSKPSIDVSCQFTIVTTSM